MTGGVLYSVLDKRQIAAGPYKTGVDATNTVTTERRVSETGTGDSQLIPFSFFNVMVPRFAGYRAYLAVSFGIGLNLNNRGKVPEYFFGAGVGLGRIAMLHAGYHFGTRQEPANGFAVGDVLPDKITTVPTVRSEQSGFAVGISYGVPLK